MITLAAASAVVINVQPAAAKIACSNGFQMVQGSLLATPYCQDELVAQVARQYGVRASAAEIRNNPNFKRHVCRLIGQDIRIKESCEEVNANERGRF
ncbi:MAG TPA: hypothetical protein VIF13_07180 [Hyphomicrobium sp.]|jgi:hypothetical protein